MVDGPVQVTSGRTLIYHLPGTCLMRYNSKMKLDVEQLISSVNERDEVNKCLRSIVKRPSSGDKVQAYDATGGVDKFYVEFTIHEKERQLL
jgi:hypothetical protein